MALKLSKLSKLFASISPSSSHPFHHRPTFSLSTASYTSPCCPLTLPSWPLAPFRSCTCPIYHVGELSLAATHLHFTIPSTPACCPSLSPSGPQPPPSGPCPSIQGLQLADEFIRPRALPRSMALFWPNREGIRGPLVAIGHKPWSLEVGQKSPRMSHMSIFGLVSILGAGDYYFVH